MMSQGCGRGNVVAVVDVETKPWRAAMCVHSFEGERGKKCNCIFIDLIKIMKRQQNLAKMNWAI